MDVEDPQKQFEAWKEYVEVKDAKRGVFVAAGLFVCGGVGLLLVGLLLISLSALGEGDLGVILVLCGCLGIGVGISCFTEAGQMAPVSLPTPSSAAQLPGRDRMSARFRWRSFALAAVLVGAVAFGLFLCKMRERKEFVSRVAGGYRCRCTLSPDWKRTEVWDVSPGLVEEAVFFARPTLIQEWIMTHLCGQPPSNLHSFLSQETLILETEAGKGIPATKGQAGYPELDASAKPLMSKHYRIDGGLATLTVMDIVHDGFTTRSTYLLVCTPDSRSQYRVCINAIPQLSVQVDREMAAILSSFHIEKVAVTSGK